VSQILRVLPEIVPAEPLHDWLAVTAAEFSNAACARALSEEVASSTTVHCVTGNEEGFSERGEAVSIGVVRF